ncbi:hypothetical protein BGW39_007838 [Mortierella sp. 14UC]|nr:hypothetical protein BGW39_007838 [Mortierella sp. 14UC]
MSGAIFEAAQDVTLRIRNFPLPEEPKTLLTLNPAATKLSGWCVILSPVTRCGEVVVTGVKVQVYQFDRTKSRSGATNNGIQKSSTQDAGHKYLNFDIILSTELPEPRTTNSLWKNSQPIYNPPFYTPPQPPTRSNDIMPHLLKDVASVNVCFKFPMDTAFDRDSFPQLGIWAHSLVLQRSDVWTRIVTDQATLMSDVLFKETGMDWWGTSSESTPIELCMNQSATALSAFSTNNNNSGASVFANSTALPTIWNTAPTKATTIPSTTTPVSWGTTASTNTNMTNIVTIERYTLVTFCALLRYLYTGEIKLAVDLADFVVSISTNDNIGVYDIESRESPLLRWNPNELRSDKTIRSTTYVELIVLANHYGLHDLVQFCEDKIIAGLSETTVCRVLLDVAPLYPRIKEPALEYVIRNRGVLLGGGRDLFAEDKDHPNCYKTMLEIMRLLIQNMST